jgi:cell division septal protein FtsQ
VALKRHKVALRKSHVRYRWRSFLAGAWAWSRRLFFMAFGAWLASLGYAFWTASPLLRVTDVVLPSDAPAGLAETVGVFSDDHLFGFSAGASEARVAQKYRELTDVRVRRRLDRRVTVAWSRRVPVARVFEDGGWLGVDGHGVFFPIREENERLVILSGVPEGEVARSALDFVDGLRKTGASWAERVYKVRTTPAGETFLYVRHNDTEVPVFWGRVDEEPGLVDRKAARLERVFADAALVNGADYVRFISEDRVAVKPAVAEMRPGKTGKPEAEPAKAD